MKALFSEAFRKYFFNTAWLLAEKVLRLTIQLFVWAYVARVLGPDKFGLLSYALSFVGLFSALAVLGLDNIVIRELVKNPRRQAELLGTTFVMKLLGALLALTLLAVALPATNTDFYTKLLIFIIAVGMLLQPFNVIDLYFQSRVQSKRVVYVKFVQTIASSMAYLVLAAIAAHLLWFAMVTILDALVIAVGLVLVYRHDGGRMRPWTARWVLGKSLIRDAWPLVLAGVAMGAYMKIDQVMIKELLNAQAVGQYAAAARISEALYFLPLLINASLFPAIVSARQRSQQLYNYRLQHIYELMAWSAIGIAIPVTIFADDIVFLLFGAHFAQASAVLTVHVWAGVFVFLGVPATKWLVIEGLERYMFYRASFGLIMNIVLNYLLIPHFGIVGAAVATLISRATTSYLVFAVSGRTWPIFSMQTRALVFPKALFETIQSGEWNKIRSN